MPLMSTTREVGTLLTNSMYAFAFNDLTVMTLLYSAGGDETILEEDLTIYVRITVFHDIKDRNLLSNSLK